MDYRKGYILACLLLTIAGCASLPTHFEALDDHGVLGLAEMLKRIENEELLFLGEAHTDSSDHLFQAEVVKHLHAQGREVAVALEVFPQEWQHILNSWARGLIDEHAFSIECERIWGDLFFYYGDILRFARDSGIRLVAIGAPKGLINSVARQGTGVIPLPQQHSLGISDCSEDPAYESLMRSVVARNVHEVQLPYFCEAQRLTDAIMAENLAELITNKRKPATVVLIGAAHAAKIAVPRIVARSHAVSHKVLLPGSFGTMLQDDITTDIADYVWY